MSRGGGRHEPPFPKEVISAQARAAAYQRSYLKNPTANNLEMYVQARRAFYLAKSEHYINMAKQYHAQAMSNVIDPAHT
jgi:hypothetical protein